MEYQFFIDTYDTERIKTLSVWSMFKDDDLFIRPHPLEKKDRSPLEHMVHQCVSEDKWFFNMFGIDVDAPPLPEKEIRLEFIKRYAEDSGKRYEMLKTKDKTWWEEKVSFFDTKRSRTWIMLRRIAHTAHHRGEQTAILRILGRDVYSVYGPSADSGGLPQNNAKSIYAYPDIKSLIEGESKGGLKAHLPGPGDKACTERPDL
ncbi:MAG: damage-inducible protein DinB [Desulfobacteraceae bacterium]|nr:MAG: damage-inducible protein DinB [Desulfobacteraceae bacterium]